MITATVIPNNNPQYPFAVEVGGERYTLREAQVFARCAMLGVPNVAPGAQVLVNLWKDPKEGNSAWLTEPRVDIGEYCWKHPECTGYQFGNEQGARNWATQNQHDPNRVFLKDTLLTIGEVVEKLRELENTRLKIPKENWRYYLGPFDEYVSVRGSDCKMAGDTKWPHRYHWITAYVVTGSSEGLYLHVDVIGEHIKGGRHTLILANTCSSGRQKWFECYESAAHISRYLGG
jgi:hypothetical protein